VFRNGNTLDQAYDQGGAGAGRIINATDGDFQVSSGRVELTHINEASGIAGTGVLEISNSLRLDGNEIITNTGNELFLQNGNNGDFSVDGLTLFVDASANEVGIGTAAPTATLDVRGSAVFNESSDDNDFRIESNNDANMFFVNGGTDRVGIGDVNPGAKLEINTADNERALLVTKTTGASDAVYIANGGTRNGLYINSTNSSANAPGLSVIGQSNNQYAHGITAVSNGYYCNLSMITIGGSSVEINVSGINAAAETIGVHGRANNANLNTTDKIGGFFNVTSSTGNNTPAVAAVGAVIDNTTYKILGYGAVSTLVKDTAGEERIMVAPEAPEALFQDYGTGQLSGGRAIITLDPILTKNIHVSEEHPLKVFVQLEGDCNGVFVTKKTADGFEVVELNNGVSNTKFSYQIVARRADEERGGRISKYSEMRFKPLDRKFVIDQKPIHVAEYKSDQQDDNIAKTEANNKTQARE
jgi:hypothetical protein